MAGQAVNLSGQINNLANSILQPATLSQSQQGLLGNLGESLAPTPTYALDSVEGLREAVSESVRRGDTASATRYAGLLKDMQSSAATAQAASIKAKAVLEQNTATNAQATANESGRNRRAREKAAHDDRTAAIKELNAIRKEDKTAANERSLVGLKNQMIAANIQTRHANALELLDAKDTKGIEKEDRRLQADIAQEKRRLDAEIDKEERKATTWSEQRAARHKEDVAKLELNNIHRMQDVTLADGKLIKLLLMNTDDPVLTDWLENNDHPMDWLGINDDSPVWQKLTTQVIKEKARNGGNLDSAIHAVIKGL